MFRGYAQPQPTNETTIDRVYELLNERDEVITFLRNDARILLKQLQAVTAERDRMAAALKGVTNSSTALDVDGVNAQNHRFVKNSTTCFDYENRNSPNFSCYSTHSPKSEQNDPISGILESTNHVTKLSRSPSMLETNRVCEGVKMQRTPDQFVASHSLKESVHAYTRDNSMQSNSAQSRNRERAVQPKQPSIAPRLNKAAEKRIFYNACKTSRNSPLTAQRRSVGNTSRGTLRNTTDQCMTPPDRRTRRESPIPKASHLSRESPKPTKSSISRLNETPTRKVHGKDFMSMSRPNNSPTSPAIRLPSRKAPPVPGRYY